MFDFIFENKKKELVSYFDLITADINKVMVGQMAVEKAVLMIGKAIAKSEIQITNRSGIVRDEIYYALNVQPNPNETGTEFWMKVVKKLLTEGECCLFVDRRNQFFVVENFTTDNAVTYGKTYRNITISSGGNTLKINKTVNANDMVHMVYENKKIKRYLENMLSMYEEIISCYAEMQKIANTPKFKLKIDGSMPVIVEQDTNKQLTATEYAEKVKNMLSDKKLTVYKEQAGLVLEHFKIETSVKTDDIEKMRKMAYEDAAMAFDIPDLAYFGKITEKSDATNEFITFAVSPVAEVINDSLNAKFVGKEDFLNGERCAVNLAHYKHVDIIDSASNLDKLRSIGFSLDEIREIVGYPALNTEFSQKRALTKNYMSEGEEQEDEEKNQK